MREIEFRGKRKDNGEWVYGYYVKLFTESLGWNGPETTDHLIYTGENECISSNFERERTHNEVAFAVDAETVGQYTGLHDKNGKKIYEGDVVMVECQSATWEAPEISCELFDVVFSEYYSAWYTKADGEDFDLLSEYADGCEILGNVYEKPPEVI